LKEKTLSKEFCINVEKDQKLDVKFIPSPSNSGKFYAFINGIEIVSMPTTSTMGRRSRRPYYVGQNNQFPIDYKMALEKVVRLNVGGASYHRWEILACLENGPGTKIIIGVEA
jgi:hypothetical protein